eukprot:TRINITY_DN24191_c0_g1_i1.p1 TRINITY_DN24191_c0_g1~~TRINITY_DN24191_c0_g1_i1.p1  ORF type:complete len:260 (+),score=67.12 TRINITY_DN24191_c0_g1_i1:64-843(+)
MSVAVELMCDSFVMKLIPRSRLTDLGQIALITYILSQKANPQVDIQHVIEDFVKTTAVHRDVFFKRYDYSTARRALPFHRPTNVDWLPTARYAILRNSIIVALLNDDKETLAAVYKNNTEAEMTTVYHELAFNGFIEWNPEEPSAPCILHSSIVNALDSYNDHWSAENMTQQIQIIQELHGLAEGNGLADIISPPSLPSASSSSSAADSADFFQISTQINLDNWVSFDTNQLLRLYQKHYGILNQYYSFQKEIIGDVPG